MSKNIEVLPYDANWRSAFEIEAKCVHYNFDLFIPALPYIKRNKTVHNIDARLIYLHQSMFLKLFAALYKKVGRIQLLQLITSSAQSQRHRGMQRLLLDCYMLLLLCQ